MSCGRHFLILLVMAGLAGATLLATHHAQPLSNVQVRRSAWTGVYSEDQAERGAKVYRKACGYCHRDNLLGDYGPPLVGVDFTYPWDGRTLGELYEVMSSRMPPPSAVDRVTLESKDYVDIISFILRSNGLPAGAAELPTDMGRLNEIVFTRQATPR